MAVTLTADELAAELDASTALATRLLAVATELVEGYAPSAPESVQNQAAIMVADFLDTAPSGPLRSEAAGPLSADYQAAHLSPLRHSRAQSLLSRWRVRRAGSIGGA